MIYNCKILDIDEEEISIKINNFKITGFSPNGCEKSIGEEVLVEVLFYDDLEISETNTNELSIIRKANTYSYSIYGTLDIDNAKINSIIDFEIEPEELFNYGYLDGKNVRIDVTRIDFYFD